jgi:hypothetical protein
MTEIITYRGTLKCRICDSPKLASVLNLGLQPLPSEYGWSKDEEMDTFPLHLRICQSCGLGQLGEYVLPERIFHKAYPYLSSASSTWVEHASQFAYTMKTTMGLNTNSLVVELASNDGYLLSSFRKLGIKVLGVEPAENVAEIARAQGVTTISKFFGAHLAEEILEKHGYANLIIANNVFAHIPDMHDFISGIKILANEDTVITIENPSFTTLLQNTLFDTIYHEHYSYLTAHSVQNIAQTNGLSLVQVDHLPTHGGSNRYWLSRSRQVDETVFATLEAEKQAGLFNPTVWSSFALRARICIESAQAWFLERNQAGDVVVGYGAAHKGNTFLNAVGDASKTLLYVVDASIEKQGKFLPGSQIPVFPPELLGSANPTDVLILPWNIAPEITQKIRQINPKVRIWVAQPEMRQL